MVPPSIRRAWWWWFGACAGPVVLVALLIGTLIFGVLKPGRIWDALSGLVLFDSALCGFGALFVRHRVQERYRSSPSGLCGRCEYPLPEHAGASVRCPECGIVRTREEHRRDWSPWIAEVK